jgi:hypothetical protein
MSTKSTITTEIIAERAKQEQMWGNENDDAHSEEAWSAIITHELGQACFHEDNSATFRKQMIKVAAVAVAAIEAIDRAKDVA